MKSFFDKILNFFGLQRKPSNLEVELAKDLKEFELLTINNSRLEAVEKKIIMIAFGLEKINMALAKNRDEIVGDREFLVHIATLHEELLNQLDQGKIVMMRNTQMSSAEQEVEHEAQTEYPKKHKFNIN